MSETSKSPSLSTSIELNFGLSGFAGLTEEADLTSKVYDLCSYQPEDQILMLGHILVEFERVFKNDLQSFLISLSTFEDLIVLGSRFDSGEQLHSVQKINGKCISNLLSSLTKEQLCLFRNWHKKILDLLNSMQVNYVSTLDIEKAVIAENWLNTRAQELLMEGT
jgi:hypothetical protein